MAIRVSHSGSPAAYGMGAYTAGRNKARDRQKKTALDMWQQERQQSANIYRRALSGTRARQSGQSATQQQGTWTDQLDTALAGGNSHDAVQIKAQRKANERARRQGKPIPYRKADEGAFTPALTKEDIAKGVYDRKQKDSAEKISNQQTFDAKKTMFEGLKERFDKIDPRDPLAWADENRREEYKKIKRELMTGEQDQKGDKAFNALEFYNAGIAKMGEFLGGHDDSHLIPLNQRKGNTRVDEEQGVKYRKKEDGTEEISGLVDDLPGLTLAGIKAGDSKNYKWTPFGFERRVIGNDGKIEWEPIEEPKAEETASAGEQYNEWGAKWTKAYNFYIKEHNITVDDPDYEKRIKEARAHADEMFPKPAEGGGSPAAAGGGSPAAGGGGGNPADPYANQRQGIPQPPGPAQGPMTAEDAAAAAAKQQQELNQPQNQADMDADLDSLLTQSGIQQPKTPEEAGALTPGSTFIAPDGTMKTVPFDKPQPDRYGGQYGGSTTGEQALEVPLDVAGIRKQLSGMTSAQAKKALEDWDGVGPLPMPAEEGRNTTGDPKPAKPRNTTGDPKNRKPISERTPEEQAEIKAKRVERAKRYQEIRARQKESQNMNKVIKGTRQSRTAARIAKKEQEKADRIAKKNRRTA